MSDKTDMISYAGSTYGNLFRDFIQADNSTEAHGLNVRFDGLTPNTPYEFRLWSFDHADPGKILDVFDAARGVQLLSDFQTSFSIPSSLDQSAIDLTIVTSSSGTVSINMIRDLASLGDSVPFNGFQISEMTPDIALLSANYDGNRTVQFDYSTTDNPGSFDVGLYRSTDGITYNPADLIATKSVTPNPAGSGGDSFTLASSIIGTSHYPYLMVVADPSNAVGELNEDNNSKSILLPIPDLAVTSLNIVTIAQSGRLEDRLLVTYSYTISGSKLPLGTSVALYWSDNNRFEPAEDTIAFSFPISGEDLRPGIYNGSVSFSVISSSRFSGTSTNPYGPAYLLLVVDPPSTALPRGVISETNETNNVLEYLAGFIPPNYENPNHTPEDDDDDNNGARRRPIAPPPYFRPDPPPPFRLGHPGGAPNGRPF